LTDYIEAEKKREKRSVSVLGGAHTLRRGEEERPVGCKQEANHAKKERFLCRIRKREAFVSSKRDRKKGRKLSGWPELLHFHLLRARERKGNTPDTI